MADGEAFERDMKDFEFLQLCKFRVQPPSQELPVNRGNFLACSSKYGLLVYCTKQGFCVVKTSSLMKINEGLGKERNKVVIEDIPIEQKVDLTTPVLSLSINSEGKYLAVVIKGMGQLSVLFYDINAFADKAAQALPFARANISATPAAVIQDLCWNPAMANTLAVCTSDGNVELIDIADNPKVVAALPEAVGATCFCWSPKGKQLLVGKKNGSASQYDHSLAEKKQWPCPNVLQGSQKVVDILWQSTYTFMAAYLPFEASTADQPKAVLVISNKENKTQYIMFDDIVFGSGEDRKAQYFFHLLLQWEMILIGSSNATEATVVGKNLDDKVSWDHWNLEDCSRAELPLTEDQNDSFPVGMAIDYSPQAQIVINESVQYPACPVMYLLSTDGMLLGFHLSYRHKDAVPITVAASGLEPNTARKGVTGLAAAPQNRPSAVAASTPVTPAAPNVSKNASTPSTAGLFGLSGQTGGVPPSFQFAIPGGTTSKPAPLFTATPPTSAQPPNGLSAAQKAPASLPSVTPSAPGSSPLFPTKTLGGNTNTQGSGFAGFGSAGSKLGSMTTTQSSAFVTPTTGQSQLFGALGSKPTQQVSPAFQGQGLPKPVSTQPGSTPATVFGGAPSKSSPTVPPATSIFGLEKGKSPASNLSAFMPSKPLPQALQTPAAHPVSNVTVTPQQTPTLPKNVAHGQAVESQKSIDARLDSAFTQNIIEEIRDFEEELKQLRARAQSGIRSVGTREEMQQLRQDTEKMVNFSREIKLVTKEHLREAQEQKNTSYNLFAMAEECRVKHERDQDPHYHSLLQGRTLDPASAERLKRLQGMAQALEQSVVEVDTVLNAQWDEHQARRRRVERMSTPTSDVIYKSIKNNHDLITDQRHKLEKVEEQLHNLKLYSRSGFRELQALSMSKGVGVSSLMENKKPEKTMQEAVSSGMTPDKVSRLKDMLSQRSVPVIKSSPLANLSVSRIVAQTPQSAGKTPSPSSQGRAQQQHLQQVKPRPQQQQTTPTGPPLSHVAVPAGKLSFVPDQSQLQKQLLLQQQQQALQQKQSFGSGQKPLTQNLMFGGAGLQQQQLLQQQLQQQKQLQQQQLLQHQQQQRPGPTSFSGVAFFKQPSPSSLSAGTGVVQGQGFGHSAQPVDSPVPAVAAQSLPTVVAQASPKSSGQLSQLLQSNMYEDLTPTETEEEDGYDEEEDGYEDEDEDEDETKFVGMPSGNTVSVLSGGGGGDGAGFFKVPQAAVSGATQQAFTPLRTTTQTQAAGLASSAATSVPTQATRQPASKDLFGAKFTTATSDVEPAVSARSGSIGFSFGQAPVVSGSAATTTGATAASTFSFGKPSSSAFGGQGGSVTQPATATTSADGPGPFKFSTEPKPGFSFGGPASFGQKLAGSAPTGSQGSSLFGAHATPSKNVGFGDLSKPPTLGKEEEKPSTTGAQPEGNAAPSVFGGSAAAQSSTGNTFGFKLTPTSTTSIGPVDFSFKSALGSVSTAASSSTSPTIVTAQQASVHTEQKGNQAAPLFGNSSAATLQKDQPKQDPTSSTATSSPPPPSSATTAATPNVFGSAASPPSANITKPSVTSNTGSFGSPASSGATLFGKPVSTEQQKQEEQEVTTTASQPAHVTPDTTVTASVFGSSSAGLASDTVSSSATVSSPVTAAPSLFGKPQGSTFSFGTAPSSTSSETSGFFGSSATTTEGGLFGSSAAKPQAATNLFGVGSAPASSSGAGGGLFGSSSGTTSGAGLFGTPASSTTSSGGGLFGGPPSSTTSSGGGLFGGPPSSTTSSGGGLFGGPPSSTTSSGGGLFGGPPSSTTSSGGGLFGGPPSSTTSTGGGLFGGPPSSTTSSGGGLFGGPPSSTTSSGGGLFGGPPSSTTSSGGGLFGGPPSSTTSTGGGLFGGPPSSTTSSGGGLFGGPPSSTTSSGGGLFGGPPSSTTSSGGGLFGQGSMTGTEMTDPAKPSAAPGGLFGTSSGGGGVFGQQQTPPSSGFGFGQQTTSSLSFGQPSPFGQPASSSSGGLMGGFSGLGGKPSEEKAKQNVFGTPQNFGSTANQNTGLFGTGTSSTFGGFGSTNSPGTGGGSFSTGGTGVGSSGFGVAASQPGAGAGGFGTSPAFGNSPSFAGNAVFGNKPAFGATSPGGFGTTPAFGSAPAFGGSSTFGSGSAGGPSGAGSGSAGGFSSFANAAAPSFGALAQSSTSSFGGGGGFGASPQPSAQPFGSGGGGFASPQQPVFGQGATSTGFGGAAQSSGFGGAPSFGGSPAFNSYRS